MIHSMTGFALASATTSLGTLNLELRSVNSRFLELHFRLADEFRYLEPDFREALNDKIRRGKVECRLVFIPTPNQNALGEINYSIARQLLEHASAIKELTPDSAPFSIADILRWPGVLQAALPQLEPLSATCIALLNTALAELTATRAREGEQLRQLILRRVADMQSLVAAIYPHLPQLLAQHHEKLKVRLREADLSEDDERIRQELTLFAQKVDVDEELTRLSTHLIEVERVVNAGGVAGKRLEFLVQELNREANTLGSKSILSEVSKLAMELKILTEQIREQIQNIE